MRSLLLLQWSCLLLLVGAQDCNWNMPGDKKSCKQKIKWKIRNEAEATATCREYFPTTFVKGQYDANNEAEVTCDVKRQFQCDFLGADAVSMFDKCYKFIPGDRGTGTMKNYLDKKANDPICGANGALPTFYTMTQAKHIAKEAHRKGIFKMWVNVDKDGKTIENCKDDKGNVKCELAGDKGFLLYKDQWKLHKDHYWKGDELKATPKFATGSQKGEPNFPAEAKYLFFRTKTDYFNNMYQGSFERATETATAGYVCEYQAKIVPDQQEYCNRMKDLGMNAKYDDSNGRKRCVYTTLTRYSMEGTKDAIKKFQTTGCGERPSKEQLAGLDDGTASKGVYDELTKVAAGKPPVTYRVAAIKVDNDVSTVGVSEKYLKAVREHCSGKEFNFIQRQPFEIYDHGLKKDFSRMMTSPWVDGYPKDECTDFPNTKVMHSNTLAIRDGKIIDVPVPARFKAICSIESRVDCSLGKNYGEPPFESWCRNDEICKNTDEFMATTGAYATCRCADFHEEKAGSCEWVPKYGASACGKVNRYGGNYATENPDWLTINPSSWIDVYADIDRGTQKYADYINKAVVRKGCKMSFWSHPAKGAADNYPLLQDLEYGEYRIPQFNEGTLNGWESGMSTSALQCHCDF